MRTLRLYSRDTSAEFGMVTREKLYEEVWAEAMLTVAARYGVSSSFLARVCQRLNVPRPPRGYWARLAVGKKSRRPSLPPAKPGDQVEWYRSGEGPALPKTMPLTLATSAVSELSATVEPKARKHSRPHSLVIGALQAFEKGYPTRTGHLRPLRRALVDMFVTMGTLSRALNVASVIFHALEDRGHRVALAPNDTFHRPDLDEREERNDRRWDVKTWRPTRPTVVYVGNVAVGLTIYELTEYVGAVWKDGEYVRTTRKPGTSVWDTRSNVHMQDLASGRLCLRASCPYGYADWTRYWKEVTRGDLKERCNEIAVELEREVPNMVKLVEEGRVEAEIRRQRWAAEERERRRQEDEKRRLKAIEDSREQLFKIVNAWGLATRIEEFFADAELRAGAMADEERAVIADRLKRARSLLGGVDAMVHFRDWASPEERFAEPPRSILHSAEP